jgi:hypothetical protein
MSNYYVRPEQAVNKIAAVDAKAKALGHEILENHYSSVLEEVNKGADPRVTRFGSSKTAFLKVKCPRHDEVVETTIDNYIRSNTGLGCCGREAIGGKHLTPLVL